MDREHIAIEIVSDDPVPPLLEGALRRFLATYPGTWRVRINQRLSGGWTAITLDTEGFHRVFFTAPSEKTADGAMRQIRESLRGDGDGAVAPWDGVERRMHPRR